MKDNKYYMGCGGKAQPSDLKKLEDTRNYVAEPKRDGIWIACVCDSKTDQRFYSRTGKEKKVELPNLWDPDIGKLILIGELGYGSQEALQRKKELGHDFMDVFDILQYGNKDLTSSPYITRRMYLQVLYKKLKLDTKHFFLLTPRFTKDFDRYFKSQPEGLILKEINDSSPYQIGTKNPNWLKVKKEITIDMVIMDYELSTARTMKGRGMVKSVTCGVFKEGILTEMVKVGSMSHDLKKDMARNWKHLKGKVIEISCFKVFESGSLRHPYVHRLRLYKDPKDCTWEELIKEK